MSTTGRTLAVYVWKAGEPGKCGKMLMRTLALPEYPLHAFCLLVDVCPTAELTNQGDDAYWPLDELDKCFEQELLVLGLSLCGLGICPRTSAGGGRPSHLLSSPVSLVAGSVFL